MKKNIAIYVFGFISGCFILFSVFLINRINSRYIIHRPVFKTHRLSLRIECQSDFDSIKIINHKNIILNKLTNLKGLDAFILSYDDRPDFRPVRIIATKGVKTLDKGGLFKANFDHTIFLYEDSIKIYEWR